MKSVVNDILVYGAGETLEEATSSDHDIKLHKLMDRCQERNLKLNQEKSNLRLHQVPVIGHPLTSDGVKSDTEVRVVEDKPNLTDVKGVQRFLRFVNYLSKFLSKLSNICELLRKLTLKDNE